MDLAAIFIVGLLGSAHCVGMCGGFVLALSHVHENRRRVLGRQALYFFGKTVTYVALGAVAGWLGRVAGAAMAGMQQALSIGVGVLLVVIGLGLLGVLQRFQGGWLTKPLYQLSMVMGRMLRQQSASAVVGLGMVNGLLPCGLVYGMLALAASTGHPAQGALTMAVFGLATIPALYAVGVAGTMVRPVWRTRLHRIGGILVILLGLLTIARGTSVFDVLLHQGHEGATHQHEHVEPTR